MRLSLSFLLQHQKGDKGDKVDKRHIGFALWRLKVEIEKYIIYYNKL